MANPSRRRLSDHPWWTDADQAQLDYLIWNLVRTTNPSSAAIQRVIDWRDSRIIRAKARYYSVPDSER